MMHSYQTSLCYEKERLSGVHFHERLLNESGMTRSSPMISSVSGQKGLGTGVYFENSEVKASSCCMHPLQASQNPTVHVMASVPCPLGQPLFAPPVLATKLLAEDQDMEDAETGNITHTQKDTTKKGWPHTHVSANITLKDCTRSCREEVPDESGGHMFCETKRTAMRQRLCARDYRLSTDELAFVEAAVQLSKGIQQTSVISLQNMPVRGRLNMLTKPSLPSFASFE